MTPHPMSCHADPLSVLQLCLWATTRSHFSFQSQAGEGMLRLCGYTGALSMFTRMPAYIAAAFCVVHAMCMHFDISKKAAKGKEQWKKGFVT